MAHIMRLIRWKNGTPYQLAANELPTRAKAVAIARQYQRRGNKTFVEKYLYWGKPFYRVYYLPKRN